MSDYVTASYSIQMPEITKVIKEAANTYDHNYLIKNRFKLIDQFKQDFLNWVNSGNLTFSGLDTFPYVYITNGITEFIQEVIPEHGLRPISLRDEYPGYMYKAQICMKSGIKLENKIPVISLPFYSTAEIHEETNKIIAQDSIIDLAWASNYKLKQNFDLSKSKYIAYSFSKTFGIQYHRLGIVFSKEPIWSLEVYHNNYYVNLVAVDLVTKLMKNFGANYLYDKYNKEFDLICEKEGLEPTNSLWFGTRKGKKIPLFEAVYNAYYS